MSNLIAAEDLSWPGGRAAFGDPVDPDQMPAALRQRLIDDALLVDAATFAGMKAGREAAAVAELGAANELAAELAGLVRADTIHLTVEVDCADPHCDVDGKHSHRKDLPGRTEAMRAAYYHHRAVKAAEAAAARAEGLAATSDEVVTEVAAAAKEGRAPQVGSRRP